MIIASIVIGGVMGLFSQSLRFSARMEEKQRGWSILEAAADQILTNPQSVMQDSILPDYMDVEDAEVDIDIKEVIEVETGELRLKESGLFRVTLTHEDNRLSFSMLIPDESWDGELGLMDRRSVEETFSISTTGAEETSEDE
jgi:hypothetical protein